MTDPTQHDLAAIQSALRACLGEKADAYPEQTVTRFPHVASKLVELWGTASGERYLEELLVPDRSDRHGFPEDVASEIFRLSLIHGETLADSAERSAESAWSDPTEIQLRTNADALRKIADERAAARRQHGGAGEPTPES